MHEPLPRLTSHRLAAPTSDDARHALRMLSGVEVDAMWAEVTREAGIADGAYLLDIPQMEAVAAALAARPGVVGLAGHALAIRVATYKALSTVDAGASRLPADWARRSIETLLRGRIPSSDRLTAIADLDLFTPEAKTVLDRAIKVVADRFGASTGVVSIVLEGSQAFAGTHGVTGWMADVGGTPVEWSMCATVVRTGEPLRIPDTSRDVLHRTNPLVDHDGLGSYAGVPLVTSSGAVLGSCCLIDEKPHAYTDEEMVQLREMADAIVAEMERMAAAARASALALAV